MRDTRGNIVPKYWAINKASLLPPRQRHRSNGHLRARVLPREARVAPASERNLDVAYLPGSLFALAIAVCPDTQAVYSIRETHL